MAGSLLLSPGFVCKVKEKLFFVPFLKKKCTQSSYFNASIVSFFPPMGSTCKNQIFQRAQSSPAESIKPRRGREHAVSYNWLPPLNVTARLVVTLKGPPLSLKSPLSQEPITTGNENRYMRHPSLPLPHPPPSVPPSLRLQPRTHHTTGTCVSSPAG